MRSNTDSSLRCWSLGLVLGLAVNLTLWSIAGIALSPGGMHQSGEPLAGFGLLQWKIS